LTINILGISAYYHDSAACFIQNGRIVAAAQEERFTRKKGDSGFPANSIKYCLKEGNIQLINIDQIVFYDDSELKFNRLKDTYFAYMPRGFESYYRSMSIWASGKKNISRLLQDELISLSNLEREKIPPISSVQHHVSHAASAFFPSPFEKAAILCLDGVGEWATTSVWIGSDNQIYPQWQIDFPHSIGLLYSAFTQYIGFKVNSGEYKLMGLAPYGEPKYVNDILKNLIDLKEDGTFRLNMDYFNYPVGFSMTNSRFHELFGGAPRSPESEITQKDMDIARSIQEVTEEIVLRLARTIRHETGLDYLCIAGGVGLNCVVNGKILREDLFKDIWIQPAAGDAGGSLGAALAFWHMFLNKPRIINKNDSMQGALLGPSFTNQEIQLFLDKIGGKYTCLDDSVLIPKVAELLVKGFVVGWFQGRMEFGPRALGARSILGDPRNPKMQQQMNLKIKYRESFRPFAPSILGQRVSDYFELDRPSPYMLLVAPVKCQLCYSMTEDQKGLFGIEKLNITRSQIPAVTHIDYSARIQTVSQEINPRYYQLISEFERITHCPVLINTSFNVRGEPIVCTPEDAYRCFMRTEIDYLVMENTLLGKNDQTGWKTDEGWKKEYELD
jgi:carbamoyltransferase